MSIRTRLIEPGSEADKKHISIWFVTANTNKPPTGRADVIALWQRTKDLANNPSAWIKPNYGQQMDMTAFVDIEVERPEIGEKYHKLHTHFRVTCNHNSNVRLDPAYLRKFLKCPHVQIDFLKAASDEINRTRFYARKGRNK